MSETAEIGAAGIFICYRRSDAPTAASWLYDHLSTEFGGEHVFKDVNNVRPGDDFVIKMTAAVSSCRILLAVIGPDWARALDENENERLSDPDDYVRLELQIALDRRVVVIPVLVDGAKMPPAARLPANLRPLAQRQAQELDAAHFRRDLDELSVRVRELLGPAGAPVPATGEPAVEPVVRPGPEEGPPPTEPPGEAVPIWLHPQPAPQHPGMSGERGPLRLRRRIIVVTATVAVLAAVGIAALVSRSIALGTDAPVTPGTSETTPSVSASATASALDPTPTVKKTATGLPQSAEALPDDFLVWRRTLDGVTTIRTVSVSGGEGVALVEGDDISGAMLTPDRRTVLYRELDPVTDVRTLHAISADGRGDRVLFSDDNSSCRTLHRTAINGDGLLAVVCGSRSEGKLTLMRTDGSVVRILDQGTMGDPTFNRDGTEVIYWRDPAGGADFAGSLYAKSIEGSTPRRALTRENGKQDGQPALAPKGDQLLFSRKEGGVRTLRTVQFTDGEPQPSRRLTDGPNDQDPSWSPDGSRLALRGGPDAESRLYLTDAEGGNVRPLPNNPGVGTGPVWTTR